MSERNERIHSDLFGPIDPPSVKGYNYGLVLTDEKSRYTEVIGLRTKTSKEVLDRFKEYKQRVELESGNRIKILRTDGGGEYEKVLEQFLKSCGIKHEISAPYSQEQNGISERTNRTILEQTKAILAQTGLPKPLWLEIASTVVYLKNRSPSTALEGITPHEAWTGHKPDLSHLRVLGSTVYVHVAKGIRKKLDYHTRKCRLVGYGGTNQWKCWDDEKGDVIIAWDTIFDEEPITNTATLKEPVNSLNIAPKRPQILDEIVVQPVCHEQRPNVQSFEHEESSDENEDEPTTAAEQPQPSELIAT